MHGRGGQDFFLLPSPCDFLGIRKKKNLDTVLDIASFFFEVVREERFFDLVVEKAFTLFH